MALLAHLLSSFKRNKKHDSKRATSKSQKKNSQFVKARMGKEIMNSMKDSAFHCCYGLVDEHDPFNLQAIIVGPSGTPYDGGIFFLSIRIPHDYPFKPPKIKFKTKVFHPNVTRDGTIHIDILSYNWSPAWTIDKLLLSICSFLPDPNHELDSCNYACHLYSKNRKLYNHIAKEWTFKYAMA